MKRLCHIWIPWPKKPTLRHTSCRVSKFKILPSDQRLEVTPSHDDLQEVNLTNYGIIYSIDPQMLQPS